MTRRVLYLAAHGGFAGLPVPLGGGAAVCERLLAEWERTKPFEVTLVAPSILGSAAPSARELVAFTERQYARFCRDFSRAATAEVLRHDPEATAILVNDVSEGPDFRALAAAGFRVTTIYHADVVAYVAAMYGRSLIRPETLVRWHGKLRQTALGRMIPAMAELVFERQEHSLRYSRTCVVPSAGMRETMRHCYPGLPQDRIHVLSWGLPEEIPDALILRSETARLRAEYGIPGDARVLLTLSRISPEKGQDLLIEALLDWERRPDFPKRPLWLLVCGDAAYMQGRRFQARLKALAGRLRRVRIVFAGHVTGWRKRAFFELADVYVFPSRHESYGLTLLEALRAGVPAVALLSDGARSVMRPEFGELVPIGSHAGMVKGLRDALARILSGDDNRKAMGEAARRWASTQSFESAAADLARLISHEPTGGPHLPAR